MARRACVGGEEYDAFTGWRHVLGYLKRPGARKKIKQRVNRRERRAVRQGIRAGMVE